MNKNIIFTTLAIATLLTIQKTTFAAEGIAAKIAAIESKKQSIEASLEKLKTQISDRHKKINHLREMLGLTTIELTPELQQPEVKKETFAQIDNNDYSLEEFTEKINAMATSGLESLEKLVIKESGSLKSTIFAYQTFFALAKNKEYAKLERLAEILANNASDKFFIIYHEAFIAYWATENLDQLKNLAKKIAGEYKDNEDKFTNVYFYAFQTISFANNFDQLKQLAEEVAGKYEENNKKKFLEVYSLAFQALRDKTNFSNFKELAKNAAGAYDGENREKFMAVYLQAFWALKDNFDNLKELAKDAAGKYEAGSEEKFQEVYLQAFKALANSNKIDELKELAAYAAGEHGQKKDRFQGIYEDVFKILLALKKFPIFSALVIEVAKNYKGETRLLDTIYSSAFREIIKNDETDYANIKSIFAHASSSLPESAFKIAAEEAVKVINGEGKIKSQDKKDFKELLTKYKAANDKNYFKELSDKVKISD